MCGIKIIHNTITNTIPFILTANATNASYQWLDCNNNFAPIAGETGQSFTGSVNGNHAVAITQNGCTDTSICYSVTNAMILENTFSILPKLYPNPTSGELTLELGNAYDELTIQIRNISGQLISTKTYTRSWF